MQLWHRAGSGGAVHGRASGCPIGPGSDRGARPIAHGLRPRRVPLCAAGGRRCTVTTAKVALWLAGWLLAGIVSGTIATGLMRGARLAELRAQRRERRG